MPPSDNPPTAERRWRDRPWVLATSLVLVAGALAAIIYFLGQSLGYWGSTAMSMPDLIGHSSTAARSSLAAEGLSVRAQDIVASSEPVGVVTATQPAAGDPVKKGQAVTLF